MWPENKHVKNWNKKADKQRVRPESSSVRDGREKATADYGGKDLWNRWVLSLEWKTEGVMDGCTV